MFRTRVNRLQNKLVEQNIDALLITSVPNIAYLTGVTHFSKEEREAYILVTQNHLYIFTDARYTGGLVDLDHLSVQEISHEFSFSKRLIKVLKNEKIKLLGFEEEQMTIREFRELSEKLEVIPKLAVLPTSGIVEELRIIKDETEIENLRKAAELTDRTFTHILSFIKLGITEYELAAELKYFIEKTGGGIAFEPIVAFGTNSAVPHHQTKDKRLTTKDSIILFDFAASWNGYCADMSRTIFFGLASGKLKKMYQAVLEAQMNAIEYLHGTQRTTGQIDKIARDYIISKGFPSIPHSTGHGIGLQVHEQPSVSPGSKTPARNASERVAGGKLKPGMVITVEPGIYDLKIGGVRIEDDVLITNSGSEILTKSSKNLIEI